MLLFQPLLWLLNFLFFLNLLLPLGTNSFCQTMSIENLLTLNFSTTWVMALDKRSSSVGIFVFIIYGFSTRVIHIADHKWINYISQHQNFHFVISLNPLTIGDFIRLNWFIIGLKRRTIIIKLHVQINPIFPHCVIGSRKYTIFHDIIHIQRTSGV